MFDYIICHGVFSWVPPAVQTKSLDLCLRHTTPDGVSSVSYNTYPGWHVRDMLRRIMLETTAGSSTLRERVNAARTVVRSLEQVVDEGSPYGALFRSQIRQVMNLPDEAIAHDYLEAVNDPVYVEDFIRRVRDTGLHHLTDQVAAPLLRITSESAPASYDDEVRWMQYADYANNTAFRRAILCRPEDLDDRPADARSFSRFEVASALSPTAPIDLLDRSEAEFVAGDRRVRATSPAVKAALCHLRGVWPASTPIQDLSVEVADRLADASSFGATEEIELHLTQELLPFNAHRAIEFTDQPYPFTTVVSEYPLVSQWARLQVTLGATTIANRKHEPLVLDDMLRFVLLQLDGRHNLTDLAAAAAEAVAARRLTLGRTDDRAVDAEDQLALIVDGLPQSLQVLAEQAMLIA